MTAAWARFVLIRLTGTAIVLVLLSFGIFSLIYLAPGSIEQTLLGTRPATPESRAAIRAAYHLNEPFIQQYGRWLGAALQGDFGTSIRSGSSVLSMISSRVGVTLQLAAFGTLLALVVGLPLGIWAALRRGRIADQAIVSASVAGLSAPPFAVGLVLLTVFAVHFGWFPVYAEGSGFADRIWHLTLPAVALAVAGIGLLVRFTRTALVRELGQDYVVFAQARGLSRGRTLRYALRNALVPVLTATGLILTSTLVGTVVVEVVFALPGLGTLLVDSVQFKDVPVVQGVALLLTLIIALINFVVDVAYAWADPRLSPVGDRA